MFRPFVQSARCAIRASQTSRVASIRPSASSFVRSAKPSFAPSLAISRRHYASSGSLSQKEVEGRIMDLLKGFDKVQEPTKLSATSHFSNDLGLDSLDTVEVVMAIEEEFSIEIPDKEADAIHSVDKAVTYILSQPDAH